VPLAGITVNRGLDVRIEERDDESQKSFASTRGLTRVPVPVAQGWREVDGRRTVDAYGPASRGHASSKSRSRGTDDVESGRAF
jgi:hypothetical protein